MDYCVCIRMSDSRSRRSVKVRVVRWEESARRRGLHWTEMPGQGNWKRSDERFCRRTGAKGVEMERPLRKVTRNSV